MTKPCRLVRAHVHTILPAGSAYTSKTAKDQAPPGFQVLRLRWLDSREWQVCYVPAPGAIADAGGYGC